MPSIKGKKHTGGSQKRIAGSERKISGSEQSSDPDPLTRNNHEMLLELVWHEDYTYYSRKAINNHVSNLRKKIRIAQDLPDYVKSVYGVGYKFDI